MANFEPKCVMEFDGQEYSKEEQAYLIFRFVQILDRLDKEQKLDKDKNRPTVE